MAYLFAYLVVIDIALLPLDLFLSFNVLTILVLPILEETLKLYIARKHREYAFFAIVLFGLMELVLVKGLLLVETPPRELPLLTAFALLAFVFHLSTASAYASDDKWIYLAPIFGACLGLHVAFNATDLVVPDVPLLLATNAILALAPIAVGSLIRRHRRRKEATY